MIPLILVVNSGFAFQYENADDAVKDILLNGRVSV
jgi:hypothetical protein